MTDTRIVQHGHCSRCLQPSDDLYVEDIEPGQPKRLRPKPPEVHTGSCRACLRSDAFDVLEQIRVLPEHRMQGIDAKGWAAS